MSIATHIDIKNTKTLVCDVIDVHGEATRLLDPIFQDYGSKKVFHGPVATLKCFEDNLKLREIVTEAGQGRVLVVDGGGALRHALIGGNLAVMAAANGWAGMVINGAVRDVAELQEADIGIKALAPCPRSSFKRGTGERDVAIRIAGQPIKPNDYLYADLDGVLVTDGKLHG